MERYYKIENTDLKISTIGLGTVNAGLAWDGAESRQIFDTYVGLGGTLIDCARVYSDWVKPEIGRAERVLGDWIRYRGHHEDVTIITKCGHPRMDTMKVSRLSEEEIRSDLELSLKVLSVDAIDVYCYHRDDKKRPVSELIDIMEAFVKEGKIRCYACSNWTTRRMQEADAYCQEKGYRGFVMNEALFNYGSLYMKPYPDKTMVKADAQMLAYHKENEKNVLTPYMSLCSGFFHILDTKGEEGVKNSPYYTPENLLLYKQIKELAERYSTGISQVLLGYILTRTPKMAALISADNLDQLHTAMDTFEIGFQPEDFDLKRLKKEKV